MPFGFKLPMHQGGVRGLGVVGGGQTLGGNRGDIGNQRVQFNLAGQGHDLARAT